MPLVPSWCPNCLPDHGLPPAQVAGFRREARSLAGRPLYPLHTATRRFGHRVGTRGVHDQSVIDGVVVCGVATMAPVDRSRPGRPRRRAADLDPTQPRTNLTDTVVTRKEHTLVTSGPYRWVRHPFYSAFGLAVLANSVTAANFLSGASRRPPARPVGTLLAICGAEVHLRRRGHSRPRHPTERCPRRPLPRRA